MIEVVVSVQQRMTFEETKRRNPTVDGFTDRVPMLAKEAEVLSGLDCQTSASRFKQFELAKFVQDSQKCLLVANSLKNLTKNQIRKTEALESDLSVEVVGLVVTRAA